MRHEVIPMSNALFFEVTSDSGQKLIEAAEAKLDEYPAVKILLQDLKTAHLPSYHHCLRVGEVASYLYDDEVDKDSLFVGGVLHDIGKSYPGIPRLLDKPSMLSAKQLQIINMHCEYGMSKIMQILGESDGGYVEYQDLASAAFVAYYHHVNLVDLESLQTTLGSAILGIGEVELERRKKLTHLVHLVDQVDARTDITRPYLLANEPRQNIGVRRYAQELSVNPSMLWSEISRDFYGSSDDYNDDFLAQKLFAIRFGDQLVMAS